MKLALIFEFELPKDDSEEIQKQIMIARDEVKARVSEGTWRHAFIAVDEKAWEVINVLTEAVNESTLSESDEGPEQPDTNL